MSDLPTPTPTTKPPPPEASAIPPAPPSDGDLSNQIDSLLAEIDLGRSRLEEQAATLTSPSAPAAESPISAPEIEKELNDLLREAGASVPNAAAPIAPQASNPAEPAVLAGEAERLTADQPNPAGTLQAPITQVPDPAAQAQAPSIEPTPAAHSVASPAIPEPGAAAQPADTGASLSSQIDDLLKQAASPSADAAPADATPAPTASQPVAPSSHSATSSPSPAAAAPPAPAPAAAATPAAPAPAPAAAPPPAASTPAPAPAGPPLSQRLSAALARVLTPLSAPLASKPKAVRDSLGWVAANTVFLGGCLWVYIEFVRPDPKVAHSHGSFDFASDQVPPVPQPDHTANDTHAPDGHKSDSGHGDSKAKPDSHGGDKKAAAKKPDAKKPDPHTKAPAKGGH
ncbi:MAG: hypothetical protein WAZ94_04280 [Phycisphaerales bacterium]